MGYTKVIRSGGLVELYIYEKNLPVRRSRARPIRRDSRNRRPTLRRRDSIRRARKAFTRRVWANLVGAEKPSLFTFTMYQGLSYGTSVGIFTKFIVRFRRQCGRSFRYIAVPEFQKRGAVHWHVLFWGIPPSLACRGYFKRYRGRYVFIHECEAGRQCERRTRFISRLWLRGFVDGLITDGSIKLAGYLGKYMSKTMHDVRLRGRKAYYCSRNALRSMSVGSDSLTEYVPVLVPVDNSPLQERSFSTEWLGRCTYKKYFIDT